jgi:actin related protein 2/3 complex subunit 4
MEDVDKEISEMKLSLNARARIVAESYLTAVSLPTFFISSLI